MSAAGKAPVPVKAPVPITAPVMAWVVETGIPR